MANEPEGNASQRVSKRARGNGQGTLFRKKVDGPWYAQWYGPHPDGKGRKRFSRSTGTRSKSDAERIARSWIERAKLEEAGLLAPEGGTPLQRHAKASIASHVNDFSASKRAEGRTEKYVGDTEGMIRRTAEECGWKVLGDLAPDELERLISRKMAPTDETDRAWTNRTAHKCVTAWRTFCRWCVSDGRLQADPLARLKKPAPHRERSRRFLLPEEWSWLRTATEGAPERFGMAGSERALLYAVALETGLRASELHSLTRSSLRLDDERPHVILDARSTKNRKAARQYLRDDVVRELAVHVRTVMPGGRVFNMPKNTATAAMLRADLADAREAWITEAGADAAERVRREGSDFLASEDHDGQVVDFHALRHTCGAWASMGGASAKAVQTLMRHSTITLTLDVYGHLLPDEAAETVQRLPAVERVPLRLTGTDDQPVSSEGAAVGAAVAVVSGGAVCATVDKEQASEGPVPHGPVAESADAADLKSAWVKPVWVRVPPGPLSP